MPLSDSQPGAPAAPLAPNRILERRRAPLPRWRALTGALRALPDFIIIGAQRCGTTTLFQNLIEHPDIHGSLLKEVHYFDNNSHQGLVWYRAHFPLQWQVGAGQRVGEASPYYLYHPVAAKRLAQNMLAGATRYIAILRDPVERALSQYHHERRRGKEPLPSFEQALAAEDGRLAGEEERLVAGANARPKPYFSLAHQCHSYRARGLYAQQLARFCEAVPREQLLVLLTEELATEPDRVYGEIFDFIGVERRAQGELRRENVQQYQQMNHETRAELTEYYREPNAQLAQWLGRPLPWSPP